MVQQPPTKVYDFKKQLEIGLQGEAFIDRYFDEWFEVIPADMDDQRIGIDRWWLTRADGAVHTVEYKLDTLAAKTGFAFVEIETNGKGESSGWAFTSRAAWLIYYCPGAGANVLYMMSFAALRACLPKWMARCRRVTVQNANYKTVGLLVALSEFERIAFAVVSV